MHFAGSVVVPDLVADPLGYYLNNTCKSRSLLACAVETKVPHFIFSSTAAVYGMPEENPVAEDARLKPISPYGSSKLMTEIMLRAVGRAHALRYVALRYFNVAGADPLQRSGQSTPNATHLIKVAVQAALGKRPYLEVFGTDYPDARRNLRARLHPCERPHPRASRRAGASAGWRGEPSAELRLWKGLLRTRSDRRGETGLGQ